MSPARRAFRECRMQFPDTVSHRATISLELQRLRTLLKVHSIELHAKLLRARELPALLAAHVDPMVCAWVRHFARGSDDMRVGPLIRAWFRWYARQRRPGAYLGVEVRVAGLTRIFSGSCASDTPGQAPLRPQRRPPCPRHPIVGVCYRGGLRLGRRAAPRRDLTDSKRGNCTIRGTTRRRHAEGRLLMLQNPHHYPRRHAPSPVQDYPPGRHTAPRRDLTDSKRGNCGLSVTNVVLKFRV